MTIMKTVTSSPTAVVAVPPNAAGDEFYVQNAGAAQVRLSVLASAPTGDLSVTGHVLDPGQAFVATASASVSLFAWVLNTDGRVAMTPTSDLK